MEIDIVTVKEAILDVRRLLWTAGVFRISSYIDSSKSNFPAVRIAELAFLD
jgi:hypothetical protein